MLGDMQLYREQDRGEGFKYRQTTGSRPPSSTGPPPPIRILSTASSTVGEKGLRIQGNWSDRVRGGQPGIDLSRQRQAASEGSLPPTGWASPAPSGARGAARKGDSTIVRKLAVGEGRCIMIKGDQERIRRRDLEGRGWSNCSRGEE